MELKNNLLKFITNIISYATLEQLEALKKVALKQYEDKLLTETEHCDIEAFLDLNIRREVEFLK